jgi:hypothetical protein
MKMETVEHFAQITLVTRVLGQQQPLARGDLEKLVEARSRYLGVTSAAPMPVQSANGNGDAAFESQVPANGKSARPRASLRPRGNAIPLEN